MNIRQFMALARHHLFGLMPASQPMLAAIPVTRNDRR